MRLDLSLSVMHLALLGSAFLLQSFVCVAFFSFIFNVLHSGSQSLPLDTCTLGSSPFLHSLSRLDFPPSILDSLQPGLLSSLKSFGHLELCVLLLEAAALEPLTSMQSFGRLEAPIPAFGIANLDLTAFTYDFVIVGGTVPAQNDKRLSFTLFADGLVLDSTVLVRALTHSELLMPPFGTV